VACAGALAFGSKLVPSHTCNLAAIIEINTHIGSSHLVFLMPTLKQMMLAFVERMTA